ncbi:MAG TPA: uroporphyrinogen-III C-methyltransferase [Candidatus Binataceae bacterium]|nr:uroporphyrinogen-III C-methyltransferase [Candidatus Binataceae bacterium]
MSERGSARAGTVYLVGAGPGAPDLITLRGAQCLRNADAVFYDHLVNPALLELAPAGAELIYSGKDSAAGRVVEQSEINRMLIERAKMGRHVVRLKGGDPFIFGRGGEEAQALAKAGVKFEIVPGVTSAIAAPAFAGIPLTHRRLGSFVAIVTGHEDQSKGSPSSIAWADLARAAKRGGTILILMASARMRSVLARLSAGGMSAKTPAAAVQWGTTAAQVTVSATLGTLASECERAKLGAPAVIVVGECVALREDLKWFEKLPLFGRRIVVTRARAAGAAFAAELRALGADAIEFPAIETAPPTSYAALDGAIGRLDKFDWIIFTSRTGVECFIARVGALGHDIRRLGNASICAIGPATAAALGKYALRVAAMPAEYRAEAIIPAIGARRIRGARILIPRAQVAREVLPQELRKRGAREVEVAPAYRTVKPSGAAAERIRAMAAAGEIDLVAFTSSSTVSNFCDLVGGAAKGLKAAAIGPITAATAESLGFEVVVRAREYTVPALIQAIAAHFEPRAERIRKPRRGGAS